MSSLKNLNDRVFAHGRKHAGARSRRGVLAFAVIGLVVVLLNSTASWPVRILVFVLALSFLLASLEGVTRYYDPDD